MRRHYSLIEFVQIITKGIEEGRSLKEIAANIGYSDSYLSRIAKREGINVPQLPPSFYRSVQLRPRKFLQLYDKAWLENKVKVGCQDQEIADILGCSKTMVHMQRKKFKIPTAGVYGNNRSKELFRTEINKAIELHIPISQLAQQLHVLVNFLHKICLLFHIQYPERFE